jgi:formylglycine-generating enzyme
MRLMVFGILSGLVACGTVHHESKEDSGRSASVSAKPDPSSAPSMLGAPSAPSVSASAVASALAMASASASSLAPEEPPPPCPPDMVKLTRTCIDKYEAHLVVVSEDGEAVHPHYERPPIGANFQARNKAGAFPQAYISRVESATACKAAGKRLCTRGEWQTGCRGKAGARYPYGHAWKRGLCNQGKIHLLTQMFPKPTGGYKYDDHFNSPKLNQEPGFLGKSGDYAECHNDVGTFDMNGSLHEWVSTTVTQEFVDKMEEDDVERHEQPWREGNGIFMGGFYSTTSEHGPGCLFTTIAHEPTYHDYSTGFRCCKDAVLPPKTLPSATPSAPKLPRPKPLVSVPTPQ